MSEPEIVEILRAVPLSALAGMNELPLDVREKVATMMEMGATMVNVASVLTDGGYQIVIVPTEEEDDEYEDEMEPETDAPEPEDDYEEYSDGPSNRFSDLLDRLRNVFGKAISFEQENAFISRNRKRASARTPHDFQRAMWTTRKGVLRCRICGGPQPAEGQICAGVTMKEMGYEDEGEYGEEHGDIGGLTLRSAATAHAYDLIAEAVGSWTQYDAHYMDESAFVSEGLACVNCVAYCPEIHGCHWVEGSIAPEGVCKLWIIPERLRKDPVPVVKEIVERDGEFCVTSADGSRSFGCYPTEEEAQLRLDEVERFSKVDSYEPTDAMVSEAERGLQWREEYNRGGTAVGVARARDISNRKNLSYDTVQRMRSYFARHEVDKQGEGFSPGEDGYPSAGRIAWALWGGDAGKSWADAIVSRVDKGQPTVNDVHVNVPMGSGGKPKKKPATTPMMSTTKDIAGIFKATGEMQYTLGPWYIPDAYDAHGEWTDQQELQTALWGYMKNADRQIRLQHNLEVIAGECVEALAWPYPVNVPMLNVDTGEMVEHEFPEGTVFMGVVWQDWAWDLVKEGKIRGYSMGGAGQRVTVDLPTEDAL
jgi:hypothetical protein